MGTATLPDVVVVPFQSQIFQFVHSVSGDRYMDTICVRTIFAERNPLIYVTVNISIMVAKKCSVLIQCLTKTAIVVMFFPENTQTTGIPGRFLHILLNHCIILMHLLTRAGVVLFTELLQMLLFVIRSQGKGHFVFVFKVGGEADIGVAFDWILMPVVVSGIKRSQRYIMEHNVTPGQFWG